MILVNGIENAGVAANDRALAYGDGVFRTLPVHAGVPRQWELHYEKLVSDCAALAIVCPPGELLGHEVRRVCDADPDCALKIIVSRGPSDRGYRYTRAAVPLRVLISSPLPHYPAGHAESGVRARRCRIRLSQQPALAGLKHLNRLENVLARAEWTDPDIAEGLLLDPEDHVIGGTMTNIFLAAQAALVTPKLDRCGVAGVTRERVMRAAARHGIRCAVSTVSWQDVLAADEIILVNSLAGAWPVRDLEGATRAPGALTRAVQRWLKEDDAQMA